MVNVINVTGQLVPANTAIDLSPYLEGNIANLVGVRLLERSVHSVTFFGTPMPVHTHLVEARPDHTHSVEDEGTHSHPNTCLGSAAWSGAGHSHLISVVADGEFTPTTTDAGIYTPTTTADGDVAVLTTVGNEEGAFLTDMVVNNYGWLNAADITPAAGSVALTGRQQIHMGDALSIDDYLELRVLYAHEAAGIF